MSAMQRVFRVFALLMLLFAVVPGLKLETADSNEGQKAAAQWQKDAAEYEDMSRYEVLKNPCSYKTKDCGGKHVCVLDEDGELGKCGPTSISCVCVHRRDLKKYERHNNKHLVSAEKKKEARRAERKAIRAKAANAKFDPGMISVLAFGDEAHKTDDQMTLLLDSGMRIQREMRKQVRQLRADGKIPDDMTFRKIRNAIDDKTDVLNKQLTDLRKKDDHVSDMQEVAVAAGDDWGKVDMVMHNKDKIAIKTDDHDLHVLQRQSETATDIILEVTDALDDGGLDDKAKVEADLSVVNLQMNADKAKDVDEAATQKIADIQVQHVHMVSACGR